MKELFWLMLVLFAVAALLRSELFFYLLYLLVGLQLAARFWLFRSIKGLHWQRRAPAHAFPNQEARVEIEIHNRSLLPLPWLALHESVPASVYQGGAVREVIALGAGQRYLFSYSVCGSQRGYYRLGPLTLRSGDVLGLGQHALTDDQPASLTIYPHVRPLAELGLPAALPFGVLPAKRSLFVDPARPTGVRPYQAGDSLRRIDWKSSAHTGSLQVRRYQPAIALETLVGLAFGRNEYRSQFAYDAMERAVIAAASIAAALVARGQPLAVCASGRDAATSGPPALLPMGQGREHLLEALALLGRLEPEKHGDLPATLLRAAAQLGWGSTVVVISGCAGAELVAALLPLRARGLHIALVICDATPEELALAQRNGMAAFDLARDGTPGQYTHSS